MSFVRNFTFAISSSGEFLVYDGLYEHSKLGQADLVFGL